MPSVSLKLSLTQLPRSTFTAENLLGLIQSSLDFARSIPSGSGTSREPSTLNVKWTLAKSDADIKVFSSTYEGERWTTRVTNADIPYDLLRRSLCEGKLEAEKEYLAKPGDTMEVLSVEAFEDIKIQLEGKLKFARCSRIFVCIHEFEQTYTNCYMSKRSLHASSLRPLFLMTFRRSPMACANSSSSLCL